MRVHCLYNLCFDNFLNLPVFLLSSNSRKEGLRIVSLNLSTVFLLGEMHFTCPGLLGAQKSEYKLGPLSLEASQFYEFKGMFLSLYLRK